MRNVSAFLADRVGFAHHPIVDRWIVGEMSRFRGRDLTRSLSIACAEMTGCASTVAVS